MLSMLERPDVRHSLVGSILDDFDIALERFDAQQPIVIWRLLVLRNAKPLMVGVEPGHCVSPALFSSGEQQAHPPQIPQAFPSFGPQMRPRFVF